MFRALISPSSGVSQAVFLYPILIYNFINENNIEQFPRNPINRDMKVI
jgi:hypothetical protein